MPQRLSAACILIIAHIQEILHWFCRCSPQGDVSSRPSDQGTSVKLCCWRDSDHLIDKGQLNVRWPSSWGFMAVRDSGCLLVSRPYKERSVSIVDDHPHLSLCCELFTPAHFDLVLLDLVQTLQPHLWLGLDLSTQEPLGHLLFSVVTR